MLTDHVGLHTSCGQGGTPGEREERGVNRGEEGEVRKKEGRRRSGALKCSGGAEQRARAEGVNCAQCEISEG